MIRTIISLSLVWLLMGSSFSASAADTKLHQEVLDSIEMLKKKDSTIAKLFEEAHGYVIFPKVGKGAIGLGGAHGSGEVFEKGKLIGEAKLTQVTIGFQLGGQVYMEAIFFEDVKALDAFKQGKFALSAQASAVAAAEGVAANARYQLGVVIFTMARSGLMYEASVGGQKFRFKPIKE